MPGLVQPRRVHVAICQMLAAVAISLSFPGDDCLARDGVHIFAEPTAPITARESQAFGWPLGTLKFVNDPLRQYVYKHWGLTYASPYLCDFAPRTVEELNHLLVQFSHCECEDLSVRPSPKVHPSYYESLIPHANTCGVTLSIPEKTKNAVDVRAMTLTIDLGVGRYPLDRLAIPKQIRVEDGLRPQERIKFVNDPLWLEIQSFISARSAKHPPTP